jgi:putative transposase
MPVAIFTHKITLRPTSQQLAVLTCAVGVARFAYNWALAEWERQYRTGGHPSECALRRELNSIKREQFPWMLDVPKAVVQQAIKNLGRAFSRFFKRQAKYPRFKRRGQHDSARFDNGPGTFEFDGARIRLPIIGWIKTREPLRFQGRPLSATVSRTADRWFVSIPVEVVVRTAVRENQAAVGVDFGLTSFATLSTGEKFEAPKPLAKMLKKLKRACRSTSRKCRNLANQRRAARKLARIHCRIACIRQDFLHKFTTGLTQRFGAIGIEDLNVQGMLRNHSLARAISDAGWPEARRQLVYKAALAGAVLVIHDRWFASSKTCSACGLVNSTLSLATRMWTCKCGTLHDRDVNAAINLLPSTVSCTGSNACGEEGSGAVRTGGVKPASRKQESDLLRLREPQV